MGWGWGIREDFLQDQTPQPSLEGRTDIATLMRRGGRDFEDSRNSKCDDMEARGAWTGSEEKPAVL